MGTVNIRIDAKTHKALTAQAKAEGRTLSATIDRLSWWVGTTEKAFYERVRAEQERLHGNELGPNHEAKNDTKRRRKEIAI